MQVYYMSEDFQEDDMNIILHCNHHFHSDCVRWLSNIVINVYL